MDKKYLAKIIAKDSQGLKLISACCFKAKVKIEELKYLKKNQIFLIFLQRFKLENEKKEQKIKDMKIKKIKKLLKGAEINISIKFKDSK